jgi:DNA repair exonuclease SbcCD ATPase subunit
MELQKVYGENFLSYEQLELSLDNRGLCLVSGLNKTNSSFDSNGAGKSSIAHLICWILYDRTLSGLKADEVVRTKVVEKNGEQLSKLVNNTVGFLDFTMSGVQYRIERYRKHKTHKNTVKLFREGEEITLKKVAETNEYIQSLIGLDLETYTNAVMFGQGDIKRFSQATDKEKKDILENLLRLDVYAQAQSVAKDRLKQVEAELSASESALEKLNWKYEAIEERKREALARRQETKKKLADKRLDLSNEQDSYNQFILKTRGDDDSLEARENRIKDTIAKLQTEIDEFEIPDMSEKRTEYQQIGKQKSNLENSIWLLEQEKNDLLTKYKQLGEQTSCPVCGSEMDSTHREEEQAGIKTKLKPLYVKLKEHKDQLQEVEEQYNKASDDFVDAEQVLGSYYHTLNEIKSKQQQYKDVLSRITSKKEGHEQRIVHLNEVIENLVEEMQSGLGTEDKKEVEEEIQKQKEEHTKIQERINQLEDVVKVYSNAGVKSHVLDLVTPELNRQANKYLQTLTGSDIEIIFSTQSKTKEGEVRDKFDVQVINNSGGGTYKANSEGEKKRIDLAISLAIQDIIMSKSELFTNFILYDEVFDALDRVGCENIIQLLQERLKKVPTIFVITHNETLKTLFSQQIIVEKTGGVSKIREGSI